jgi:dolichol kinase
VPEAFLKGLEQSEYVHVLLNPLPVYGLAMGFVALIIALILRSREARILALFLIFLAAASAWPVFRYGMRGYDRVKAMSDNEGRIWLDEHKSRGERLIFVFYSLGAFALVAIAAEWKRSRAALPLAILIVASSIGVLIAGAYIGYSGGHIRHKEFRFEPVPVRSN